MTWKPGHPVQPGLLNDSPALCMDGMPALNQSRPGSDGLVETEQNLSNAGRQEPGLDDDGQDTAVFPADFKAEHSRPDQTTEQDTADTALSRAVQDDAIQAKGGLMDRTRYQQAWTLLWCLSDLVLMAWWPQDRTRQSRT